MSYDEVHSQLLFKYCLILLAEIWQKLKIMSSINPFHKLILGPSMLYIVLGQDTNLCLDQFLISKIGPALSCIFLKILWTTYFYIFSGFRQQHQFRKEKGKPKQRDTVFDRMYINCWQDKNNNFKKPNRYWVLERRMNKTRINEGSSNRKFPNEDSKTRLGQKLSCNIRNIVINVKNSRGSCICCWNAKATQHTQPKTTRGRVRWGGVFRCSCHVSLHLSLSLSLSLCLPVSPLLYCSFLLFLAFSLALPLKCLSSLVSLHLCFLSLSLSLAHSFGLSLSLYPPFLFSHSLSLILSCPLSKSVHSCSLSTVLLSFMFSLSLSISVSLSLSLSASGFFSALPFFHGMLQASQVFFAM